MESPFGAYINKYKIINLIVVEDAELLIRLITTLTPLKINV